MTAISPSTDAETTLFEGRPAAIPGVGALLLVFVTLGLAALYYWLRAQGVLYRVTTKHTGSRDGEYFLPYAHFSRARSTWR